MKDKPYTRIWPADSGIEVHAGVGDDARALARALIKKVPRDAATIQLYIGYVGLEDEYEGTLVVES